MALLAAASYAARFAARLGTLPPDTFFRYSTAIAAFAVDAVLILVVLLMARGLPFRQTFALRPPPSWGRAALIGGATLVGAYALSIAELSLLPNLAREQSVPEYWDGTRLGAWLANLAVIAVFVPVFEEALCRGLGYALVEPLGAPAGIAVTAIAFTLAHGVIADIPVILATGVGLGYMRATTGSLYPCVALHGIFNAFGLVLAALVVSR